jgi:hypothetical protein
MIVEDMDQALPILWTDLHDLCPQTRGADVDHLQTTRQDPSAIELNRELEFIAVFD